MNLRIHTTRLPGRRNDGNTVRMKNGFLGSKTLAKASALDFPASLAELPKCISPAICVIGKIVH